MKKEWNIRIRMTENEEDTRQMTLDEWVENAPTGDDFEAREYIESRIIEEALEIVSRPIFREPWMDNVAEVKSLLEPIAEAWENMDLSKPRQLMAV